MTPRKDAPRQVAYEVLRAVSEREAYANLLLPPRIREAKLDTRDASFTTELTYGTLRRLGTYDAICQVSLTREWDAVDSRLRDVLRLGTHQLLGMRVADHAAVTTSVELAAEHVGQRTKGFVNAVLRRVAERDYDGWVDVVVRSRQVASDATAWTEASVRYAHPEWLTAEFASALESRGIAAADESDGLFALLAADNAAPDVTLVAWPGKSDVAELERAGAVPGKWSPHAARLSGGDPMKVAAVAERRAGVQDEGSQLAALALLSPSIEEPQPHERWLDMCAGPGGKSALLDAIAVLQGASLEAWEVRPQRARLVQQVAPTATVRTLDASDPQRVREAGGSFDRVLLDAPCSGAGALRRRPEARWRKRPSDVRELATLQAALLRNAVELVRPGGVVVYVTCSPLLSETTAVVDTVVGSRADIERLDARRSVPKKMPCLGLGPDVQLWPHLHGTDAMYICLLRRRRDG